MSSFQLNIFKAINKKNDRKNITVSPISIYHILSLTTNGAVNETLKEMLNTLCHKNLKELNKDNKSIATLIEKFKSVEYANAVFTKVKPLELFTEMIKEYKAKMDILNDADKINKWCSEATHGKIQKIIESLSPDDVMILINIIFFKGVWLKRFDEKNTDKGIFMNYNEEKVGIDFMKTLDKFDYFSDYNIQAISIKYKHDNMVATIILPNRENNINNYIDNFTLKTYKDIIKKMKNKKVNIYLPNFEIKYEEELSKSFISLGMVQAFSENADFSSMIKSEDVKIGRIIHKTYIKIDEEGTEASAATAVVMVKKSVSLFETRIPIMKVNSPFLFIIRNENLPCGNDIIFISKIEMIDKKYDEAMINDY
ncbi:hypothetical protein BCR32DRAFT_296548 [Anaeromyces robustus]|uniref:Serpin domain-containing protein n=1 Tax=Anaeromyces robustus TaxID=1754192 RepID=A0A1Y1WR29_9FUNG|nr:hypothetical protein BCR32DRAFT_296548 [Anaeromyces robustus]|eukprot:ORX75987.1 hypothetical protein BCR32DRAFT_296548 [Anaeromyces robustus]